MAFGRQNTLGMGYSKPVEYHSVGDNIRNYLQANKEQQKIDIAEQERQDSSEYRNSLIEQQKAVAQAKLDLEDRTRNESIAKMASYLDETKKYNPTTGMLETAAPVDYEGAGGTPESVSGYLSGKVANREQGMKDYQTLQARNASIKPTPQVPAPSPTQWAILRKKRAEEYASNKRIPITDVISNPELMKEVDTYAQSDWLNSNKAGDIGALPTNLEVEKPLVSVGGEQKRVGDTVKDRQGRPYAVNTDGTLELTEKKPIKDATYEDWIANDETVAGQNLAKLNTNWGMDNYEGSKLYNTLMKMTDGNEEYVKDYIKTMASENSVRSGGFSTMMADLPLVKDFVQFFDGGKKDVSALPENQRRNYIKMVSELSANGLVEFDRSSGMEAPVKGGLKVPTYKAKFYTPDGKEVAKEDFKYYLANGKFKGLSNLEDENKLSTTARYMKLLGKK